MGLILSAPCMLTAPAKSAPIHGKSPNCSHTRKVPKLQGIHNSQISRESHSANSSSHRSAIYPTLSQPGILQNTKELHNIIHTNGLSHGILQNTQSWPKTLQNSHFSVVFQSLFNFG